MAHVRHKLRLVLAGDLELTAFLGYLLEEARVFQRNRRLVGEALHQVDDRRWEFSGRPTLQHERADRALTTQQRHDEGRVQTRLKRGIAKGIARSPHHIRYLQRLAIGDCLTKARLPGRNIEAAEAPNDLRVEPHRLTQFESAALGAVVKDRTCIGAGELDRALDDGLQHDIEIERRTDGPPDFTQRGQVAVACLHLLKQTGVLDGDHSLVGERLHQLDLLAGKWFHLGSSHGQDADRYAIAKQGNCKKRPSIGYLADDTFVGRVCEDVGNMYGASLLYRSSGRRGGVDHQGMIRQVFGKCRIVLVGGRQDAMAVLDPEGCRVLRTAQSRGGVEDPVEHRLDL